MISNDYVFDNTISILIKDMFLIGNLWKTILKACHMVIGLMVNRKEKLLA